ncbi:MAG: class I SAM-dependent methyltransferase, partial [Halobacteria archaeon]
MEQKLAWEQEHITTNWRGPFSIQPLLKYLHPHEYILDAGCGRGRYLYPLARRGYKVIGCDFALPALRELKQRGLEIAVGEISNLPFKTNVFQAVLCYGVLQHFLKRQRELTIAEMHRAIKPGGKLFLEV